MFSEDDLLPLAALQHFLFCARQCALIHLEGIWADNRLTVLGTHLHEKAHAEGEGESRGAVRIARGLRLRSLRLGLTGKADVVEFHRIEGDVAFDPSAPSPAGVTAAPAAGAILAGVDGRWQPFPVEYKRGRPKRNRCDEVQLCGQALCLEEMLGTAVPAGALFYGATRRRFDVAIDAGLRAETEDAVRRLRALLEAGVTPRVAREPKCDNCSLVDACLPDATGPRRSAARYIRDTLGHPAGGGP